jgi:hypothetical protein
MSSARAQRIYDGINEIMKEIIGRRNGDAYPQIFDPS